MNPEDVEIHPSSRFWNVLREWTRGAGRYMPSDSGLVELSQYTEVFASQFNPSGYDAVVLAKSALVLY